MGKWGGVTNGKVLAFSGVGVRLPISGPAGADVCGVLEIIMAISSTYLTPLRYTCSYESQYMPSLLVDYGIPYCSKDQ